MGFTLRRTAGPIVPFLNSPGHIIGTGQREALEKLQIQGYDRVTVDRLSLGDGETTIKIIGLLDLTGISGLR